jgi:hypothetical protein
MKTKKITGQQKFPVRIPDKVIILLFQENRRLSSMKNQTSGGFRLDLEFSATGLLLRVENSKRLNLSKKQHRAKADASVS